MKAITRAALAVLLFGVPFAFTSAIAGALGLLLSPFYGTSTYARNLIRASDKQAATLLGFEGRATISAECGASTCRACALLCRMLDWIQKGHCEGAALREGTKKP